jgi:hypothetical protein
VHRLYDFLILGNPFADLSRCRSQKQSIGARQR